MSAKPSPIPLDAAVYVAGHRGLVGSAVWRHLAKVGFVNLVGAPSDQLDLRERDQVRRFFKRVRPDYVILAAARVGGILANDARPADFLSDNLQIQVNVLDMAAEYHVERLLFLGSSCIYPKYAPQPISEDSLLTGKLERTNDAYAIAKLAGITQIQAIRRQHGAAFISALPTNIYGPGDNFDLATAHVLPAIMRRFHEAKVRGAESVALWGSGTPRREFLHVDDLASACLFLLENYDDHDPVNVGVGSDVTIKELSSRMARTIGYEGVVEWDTTKPDGTPRKLLDISRLTKLGWRPRIDLEDGISATYEWYRAQANGSLRGSVVTTSDTGCVTGPNS